MLSRPGADTESLRASSRGLPVELAETLSPREGLVVFAGATGSGKSTSMAALTRFHLESQTRPVKIVDIQKPVEYTFRDVVSLGNKTASIIGQSEVGKHIRSFALGVHSALRRKPHIIIVGEARDFETIAASIESSMTGHLVYTTTHAGSVSDTIRRLLLTFPGYERESQAFNLAATLRYLVVQHLIPRIDKPGRVPVREMLRITERGRLKLQSHKPEEWPEILHYEVQDGVSDAGPENFRQSFAEECARFYKAGIISKHDALLVGGPRSLH